MRRVITAGILLLGLLWSPLASAQQAPLLRGLVGFWPLTEASGSRADRHGSSTLTDNFTVTQATGPVYANAAQFTAANGEYLSAADSTILSTGNIDVTLIAWVYWDTAGTRGVISKIGTATGDREFQVYRYSDGNLYFDWYTNASGGLSAVSAAAPSTGAWHLILIYHDASANVIGMSIDNGTPTTAAASGGNDGTEALRIGVAGTSLNLYMDGRIGPVGYWKRMLTARDRAMIWNEGIGLTYEKLQRMHGGRVQ